MAFEIKGYKVFIASPSGLEAERKLFVEVLDEYNKIEALHRGVMFQTVRWEDALARMGRPQHLINEELKECDYFLLLLHNRWGSSPGENKSKATSGTEEEYNIAMECYKDKIFPMKQIAAVFKTIDNVQLADPGEQLQKVLEFKKKIEEEKKLLYATFFSEDEFRRIIWKQLAQWLRDHDKDDDEDLNDGNPIEPIIPVGTIPQDETIIEENIVNIETEDIIKNARKLAKEGKLTEAEIEFSKAIIYNPTAYELLSYVRFLVRIGQLDKALMMLRKLLEDDNISLKNRAEVYSSKGVILRIYGDLNRAEKMHRKSLEVFEKLDNKQGLAGQYGNLGNVLKIRGDIDGAEEMYRKSIEIFEKLDNKQGLAGQYGNLGIVLKTRGDLDGAEEMYRKSLVINKELRRKEGVAIQYGNLGSVLKIRGNLDEAEKMYKKSLKINEQLGRKEGLAIHYGNLGLVLKIRGDLDGAEEMYKKSLEINEQLGRKEGIAFQYRNLGNILKAQDDLDGAEKMHIKSLELNEQLGSKQGLAGQYGNLGNVMKEQGDLDGAKEMYMKCLEIAKKQGFAEIIRKVSESLELLRAEKKKKNS